DLAPLVAELVEVSVGEDTPVERIAPRDLLHVVLDLGRTVVGQRVVPPGRAGEVVDLCEVVEQQGSGYRGAGTDPIEVHRLLRGPARTPMTSRSSATT